MSLLGNYLADERLANSFYVSMKCVVDDCSVRIKFNHYGANIFFHVCSEPKKYSESENT